MTGSSDVRGPAAAGDAAVRLAFIGCGAVIEKLQAPAVEVLARQGSIRVAAALDTDAARAHAVAARFPGCRPVEKLSQLPDDVNLAIVATPARFHAAHAIELLGRGIHVLCEKPMAMSYDECREMIGAAGKAGRLLAIGHMRRFFPVSRQLRSLVEGRSLGRVVSFRVVEGIRYQWAAESDANFRRESGGGVLRDVGVHTLDLLLWWLGEPATVDYRDDAMGGVDANARISLGYPGGLAGEVILSRDWNLREQYFFQFENGWVSFLPYASNRLEVSVSRDLVLQSTLHEEAARGNRPGAGRPGGTFQQAFIQQLVNVIEAVVSGAPLVVPGEEGARAIRLIEQCAQSRRLIEMPWMSERELAAARALA